MTRHGVRFFQAATPSLVFALTLMSSIGTAWAVDPKGVMKPKEVKALVASARTSEDHMKLARHFSAMAEEHEAEAREHEALAVEYTRNPRMGSSKTPMSPNSAEHCKYFSTSPNTAGRRPRRCVRWRRPTRRWPRNWKSKVANWPSRPNRSLHPDLCLPSTL